MGENIPVKYTCMPNMDNNHLDFPLAYSETVKPKVLKLGFRFILRLLLILLLYINL